MTIEFSHLANVPLLEGLQPDDFNELLPYIETRDYDPGETLFLQGDRGGALMIVIDGDVELFIYDENQTRVVLSHVMTGGFFGEVTLFDNSTRSTNAMAHRATKVIILRQDVMTNFLRKQPDAAIHIINVLARRLRDNNQLITSRQGNAFEMLREASSAAQRVADHLSSLVGSWGYLVALIVLILFWIALGVFSGNHEFPSVYDALGISITILGALQLPLIMMSQNRQDKFEQIQADLDHQVNVKAQLSILEVTRKLDWLKEAMLDQATRLERLENDHRAESAHSAKSLSPQAINNAQPAER